MIYVVCMLYLQTVSEIKNNRARRVFPVFRDFAPRRGCVIVHNRDCVLSHDPGTRLLRMNIVNILLNLASPPDKPVSARLLVAGPFPFSVFHDCPSPTELATQ